MCKIKILINCKLSNFHIIDYKISNYQIQRYLLEIFRQIYLSPLDAGVMLVCVLGGGWVGMGGAGGWGVAYFHI